MNGFIWILFGRTYFIMSIPNPIDKTGEQTHQNFRNIMKIPKETITTFGLLEWDRGISKIGQQQRPTDRIV